MCKTKSGGLLRCGETEQSLKTPYRLLLRLVLTVSPNIPEKEAPWLTYLVDLDKARGAGRAAISSTATIGGGPSVPTELMPLVQPASSVSKLVLSIKAKTTAAEQEYTKNNDVNQPTPSAPVYAARLNGLLKTLATAEGAVAECVKARRELIGALEKILDTNKASLVAEEQQLSQLTTRKSEIDQKKQDVEMAIMRGLADQDSGNRDPKSASPVPEPDRPEVEALTPPPMSDDHDFYEPEPAVPDFQTEPSQSVAHAQATPTGLEALSNLASQYSAVPVATNGTNKRRKVENNEDVPDLGNDGIDPNIDDMIRQ